PDATVTLDFALMRLAGMIEKLVVYPDRMKENMDRMGGLAFSQHVLLALTQAGVSREDAYRLVQANAMDVWKNGGSFLDRLKSDPEVSGKVPNAELEAAFDPARQLAHVDLIFERVFGHS
ncbi:MAG: adenylosuccinate lyase, partial [Rhodospirillales bacterium]